MVRRLSDDGRRGEVGVLLSIRRGATEIEVTIDDVRLQNPTGPSNSRDRVWGHERFVTFLQMPAELQQGTFSSEQLSNLGATIVGCIYPLAARLPVEPSTDGRS